MRVLLYIEPHPIRNSKTHFDDIARKFLPLLKSESSVDVRMYANKQTYEKLGKEANESYSKYFIATLPEEEKIFQSYLKEWNIESINSWLNLMEGKDEVTNQYVTILHRIWRIFPFDVIIHWGENGAIKQFTRERPVSRVAMELGCTRPPFFDSIVMDPCGTNGSAMIPSLSTSDIKTAVDGKSMSRHEAIFARSQNLNAAPYEEQFLPLPHDISSAALKKERIAFIPLQLYDDANLLRFSPYKTLSEVVLDVVPKLAAQNFTIIIKPHPASKHRPNANLANLIARNDILEWSDNIIWCDRGDTTYNNSQLINLSDVVVTVNSSVGFEALYYDKPVVVLGDAIYKPKNMFPSLDQIINGSFNKEKYLENAGYLRQFFLGGYLLAATIRSNPALFMERVNLINHLQNQYGSDISAMAKGFYAATNPSVQSISRSEMLSGISSPDNANFGIPIITTLQAEKREPSKSPYVSIVRKIIAQHSISDQNTFESWIDEIWKNEATRYELIKSVGFVDEEHYLKNNADIREAGIEPTLHFAYYGIAEGRTARSSMPSASIEKTIDHLNEAAQYAYSHPVIVTHPLTHEEEESRKSDLSNIQLLLKEKGSKIAVVAHLYYYDLVEEILNELKKIPEKFDLIITTPHWGHRKIEKIVCDQYPEALFYKSANRGRDIAPFIDLLPALIENQYDVVLKIQTKRGYYQAGRLLPEYGKLWREETLTSLLGSGENIRKILNAFEREPKLNMVGPSSYFLSLSSYPYHDDGELSQLVLGEAQGNGFFAGTMFWIKPQCLQDLINIGNLSMHSFSPETGTNDGALAHLIERLFGQAAHQNGGKIGTVSCEPTEDVSLSPEFLQTSVHQHIINKIDSREKNCNTKKELWLGTHKSK